MDTRTRDRFLTASWNNRLSVALALPGLGYVAVALFSSTLSDQAAFIGMALIGAVY